MAKGDCRKLLERIGTRVDLQSEVSPGAWSNVAVNVVAFLRTPDAKAGRLYLADKPTVKPGDRIVCGEKKYTVGKITNIGNKDALWEIEWTAAKEITSG